MPPIHPAPPAPDPLRMLLVDDCRINRMLVTSMLMRWGIVPTIACNGEQAVFIAKRRDFDIVLMDMQMPVMDGVVATAKIRCSERQRAQLRHMPIVAYSSLDLAAEQENLARIGLDAVLAKPCSPQALQDCLAQWCPAKFVLN